MATGPKFVLVAGEASGDQLGAALIGELQKRFGGARFFGIGGSRMRRAGLEAWWDIGELSVMGLFEVAKHLPRLMRLRRELARRIVSEQPDVLVGIDAPDFNLGLEKRMRARGIPAVHYVSPTVWAWRRGRAARIGESADLVLCLFPFEPGFYTGYGVAARYTGHPLADTIPLENDQAEARRALGIGGEGPVIALLPGSRGSEVGRLARPMLDAAALLKKRLPGASFLAPMSGASTRTLFEAALAASPGVDCALIEGQALRAMAAADVVVCASGTATLECMLVNRPMVVAYRLAGMTYTLAKLLRLVKARFISLPNLLADENLVPELIQHDVTGANIASEVEAWLENPGRTREVQQRFHQLHQRLRRGAAASAANEICALLERGPHVA